MNYSKYKQLQRLSTFFMLIVVVIVSCSNLHASTLRLDRLSSIEGLSQSSVKSLLLDKEGYLWIATEGGLNRYDGYEVLHVYGPEKVFKDNSISKLFQDSKGNIWISTLFSGLFKLEPESLNYELVIASNFKDNPDYIDEVLDIVEDDDGTFWFALSQHVIRFNPETKEQETVFTISEKFTDEHVIRALLKLDKLLFVATSSGLFGLDLKNNTTVEIPFINREQANLNQMNTKMLYLVEDDLYLGTVEGFYRFKASQLANYIADTSKALDIEVLHPSRNIWAMLPAEDGYVLGTDDGLYEFLRPSDEINFLWRFDQSEHTISDNDIINMIQDKSGNYWLGSRAAGAYYWRPSTLGFRNITTKAKSTDIRNSEQLSNEIVWSVHKSDDQTLWLGTSNGLNRLNTDTGTVDAFLINEDDKAVYSESTIYQIKPDGDHLMLLTAMGVSRFDTTSGELVPINTQDEKAKEFFKSNIWSMHKNNDGKFWFINNDGVYSFDNNSGELQTLEELNRLINPALVSSMLGAHPTKPDNVLFSMSGGLWEYDQKTKQMNVIYNFSPTQVQSFVAPDNVVLDDDNTMWIPIPGHGLVGIDADTNELKYKFDQSNELPTETVYAAQKDDKGDIWFSSHSGLFRLQTKNSHIEQFSYQDGLATNEFNGAAFAKLTDGRLAFGSVNGMTLFDPDEMVLRNFRNDKVSITGISLLSRELPHYLTSLNDRFFEFEHDDIGIKINYSTLNFSKQKNTRYKVELIGKDSVQYPVTQENSVLFPTLSPGEYELKVQAINPTTGAMSLPTGLRFKVQYAPLTSPLAYSLYTLILLLAFSLWLRSRQRQQEELMTAHEEALASEERLQLALVGSNSGEWDWLADGDLIYESRLTDALGYEDLPNPISHDKHIDLIHPKDQERYLVSWKRFIKQGDKPDSIHFDISYRMATNSGEWRWFQDLARITAIDKNGQVERVTGTYTNITDRRANEQKARLFGQAFEQTRDWVLILDRKGNPMAANESFHEAFELADHQLDQPLLNIIGVKKNNRRFYQTIFARLKPKNYWRGEELIYTNTGKEYPSLIKISANSEDDESIDNYVVVITDITEQKRAERKLRNIANYDSLTKLPNRMLLMDRLDHAIRHARRNKLKMAMFFIDLDRFKQVNDTLGHDIGDQVLIKVAKRIQNVMRDDDTVGRLGGDEFVVVIESYERLDDVVHIAQKIVKKVDNPIQINEHNLRMTPSLGIALYPNDAETAMDLLKLADVAMYHTKKVGGSNFHFYNESMNKHAQERLTLENRLKQAYVDDDFVNYYQPIVDVANKKVVGLELLLRWQSDEGMISPAEFIPISEEIGLIMPMTEVAMEKGLTALKEWREIDPDLYLSVNLSARHLAQESLLEGVKEALESHALPPDCLRFEVTESTLMHDQKQTVKIMKGLNKIGVQLALDDFGTGYSSLQYLKDLPMQIIKIDRSFVSCIGQDTNDEAIINAILQMASSLGKICIAEGIENAEQLDYLLRRDCVFIQGYYFSRPLHKDDIQEFLDHFYSKKNQEPLNQLIDRLSGK